MKIVLSVLIAAALALVVTGECPSTRPCPRNYRPVCAFDGAVNRTYSNGCVMKYFKDCNDAITLSHAGCCEADLDTNRCPLRRRPVAF